MHEKTLQSIALATTPTPFAAELRRRGEIGSDMSLGDLPTSYLCLFPSVACGGKRERKGERGAGGEEGAAAKVKINRPQMKW